MTVPEAMAAIEQDDFAAEMNLVAGTKAFRRAMREHVLFHRLSDVAREHPSEVAERIQAISRIPIDQRYENPYDTALSAYLLVLSDVAEPELVFKASEAALKTPKIWWASGIARELMLRTVAVGVQQHNSESDTIMRELLNALSTGQPKGRGERIIEFPRREMRSMHHSQRPILRRKKGRPHGMSAKA